MSRGTRAVESPQSAISRLSDLIDAAAIAPEYWGAVCAGFGEYFPDGRVLLQGYDKAAPYAMPLAESGWSDANLDTYFSHFAALNPWLPVWKDLPVSRPVFSDAVLSRSSLERTAFFQDWLKPLGGADTASGIKITEDHNRLACLCVHYAGTDAERSHQALAPVLDALAPRMRMALDSNRAVLRRQRPIQSGSLIHDLLDPAVIVSRSCRVLGLNAAAEEFLASRSGVQARAGDRLGFEDTRLQAAFSKIVEAVCLRQPGLDDCHELRMKGEGAGYAISILPLPQNLRQYALQGAVGYLMSGRMALVIFRKSGEGIREAAEVLRLRLGLSREEVMIALASHGGSALADIALELGMASDAARVHLESAFAKTGAREQGELLATVLAELNDMHGPGSPTQ